jgi:hypothetical protein
MYITQPEVFANFVNTKISGAYRKITTNDVCLMTEYNLIGKYEFYGSQDLETVRGILAYEQLREKRATHQSTKLNKGFRKHQMCDQLLHPHFSDKRGRPGEYCQQCQPKIARGGCHYTIAAGVYVFHLLGVTAQTCGKQGT